MADCNHTCQIRGIAINDIDGFFINENDSVWINRSKKIYHLLSKRNKEGSNVRHFNVEFADEDDDLLSLKLVPKVIEMVKEYSSVAEDPLSIIYEILRGWKMPELYDTKQRGQG